MRPPTAAALAALLWLVWSTLGTSADEALKGVALVIGQSKYGHITPLANPANDAREMVKLLTDLGFDARSVTDRDTAKLTRDLERFVEDAEGADVAFLYYSGHGIEAGGENYLVPVDADVSSLDNAGEKLVSLFRRLLGRAQVDGAGHHRPPRCLPHQSFPAGAHVKLKPRAPSVPIAAAGLGATARRHRPSMRRQRSRESRHRHRLCGRARAPPRSMAMKAATAPMPPPCCAICRR